MPIKNKLKELLLHHLKRNQIKDQLVEIEKEIESQKSIALEARKKLVIEKGDVDFLENWKIGQIIFTSKKRYFDKLDKEKSEEIQAYNHYESLLEKIKKIEEEKLKLIAAFKSMENVDDQLIKEAAKKENRLSSEVDFVRKLNSIELKRKRLLKNGVEIEQVLESYQKINADYSSFYKIFRIIKYSNSATMEYHGAAKYSSYKKKKLIEKYRKIIIDLQLKINKLQLDTKAINLKIEAISLDDCLLFLSAFYKLNLYQPDGLLEYEKRFKRLDKVRDTLVNIIDKISPLQKRVDRANREIDTEKLFFITDYPE